MNTLYQALAIFLALLGFGCLMAPFCGAFLKARREQQLPFWGDRS